jgi:CHAT domain-containing protein/Flp pilus assembly protein TadD
LGCNKTVASRFARITAVIHHSLESIMRFIKSKSGKCSRVSRLRGFVPVLILYLAVTGTTCVCGQSQVSSVFYQSSFASRAIYFQTGGVLREGETLSPNLRGGETLSFEIVLTAGQFATVSVEQRGIILSVALFDPSGAQIIAMDNPSGGYGPIYLSTIARVSDKFRLDVRSTEDWANPGTFDVSLNSLRQSTTEDNTRIQAETRFAKASELVESGAYQLAIAEYEQALSIWRSINDKHWEALTQFAIGSAYRRWAKRKEAVDAFNAVLAVPNPQFESNDWRLKAATLNDLGSAYTNLGEKEKALSSLNKAQEYFVAHGDRRGQASALSNLGLVYLRAGEWYAALRVLEEALLLRRAENYRSGESVVLNNIGGAYDQIGEPYKALDYYSQALKGWQDLDKAKLLSDPSRITVALNNVGIAYDKLGESGLALNYYNQALARLKPDDPNYAATLDNKGEMYAALAEFEEAKINYDEALKTWNSIKTPDPDLKARLLVHIGQLYQAQLDQSQALRFFYEARDLKPGQPVLAYILTNIGSALSLQNVPQQALEALNHALEIQVKLNDRRGEAISRQKKAEAYYLLGQHSEALAELDRALSLWRFVQDSRGEATTLNTIARIELDVNKLDEALKHNNQAVTIIESLRTKVSSHHLRTTYFSTQENYYALNVDLNMRLYQETRDKRFLATALQASERSRARTLLDVLTETRITVTEGISPELLKLEQEVQRRLRSKSEALTRLLGKPHNDSDVSGVSKDLVKLQREYETVKDLIRTNNPRYSQLTQPQPLGVIDIQSLLDDETMLLEYALGEKRSYGWAVTKNSIEGIELPGRQTIEATALRFITALTDRHQNQIGETPIQRQARIKKLDAEYNAIASLLSQMVLEPFVNLLSRKRLLVVADGTLQFIPFTALPTPEKEPLAEIPDSPTSNKTARPRLLIDEHEIINLASASVLAVQRNVLTGRKPAPQPVAVFASAVFEANDPRVLSETREGRASQKTVKQKPQVSPKENLNAELTRDLNRIGLKEISWLPYSRDEALTIDKIVRPVGKTMLALDFKASRATITSKELSQYRILHFATHGIVNLEHPELSGIILSLVDESGRPQDGYIRLHDIYNLNLPADLVVLSACQTGVGKQIRGEGLMTLTRGFMYAGAARVVASLWKVDDLATAELMGKFYKEMFTNGRQPADALRAAQIELSRDKRWQSPYYWAGFILQGDWR